MRTKVVILMVLCLVVGVFLGVYFRSLLRPCLGSIAEGILKKGRMEPATAISILALVLSIISTWFAVHSWRQAHRPLITARINITGGNIAAALTIIVENTGNRPARNIRLSAKEEDIIAALAPGQNRIIPEEIRNIFFANIVIPVLANGRAVSNAFGLITRSSNSIWIPNFAIPIRIHYEDIEGRSFASSLNVQSAYEEAFAGSSWGPPTAI